MTQPSLTISSLDLDRLEDLLEQVDPREFPAARQLETELARADVVDPQDMPAGVVTMNSRVRFADAAGATREFQLCYPKDMTGAPDQLSVLAPVGAALLGLSAGQAIDWPLPM